MGRRLVNVETVYDNGFWYAELYSVYGLEYQTPRVKTRDAAIQIALDFVSQHSDLHTNYKWDKSPQTER